MKKLVHVIIFVAILVEAAHLRAAETWEGTDNFSSASTSTDLWKPMGKSKKAFQYVSEGQLRCSFNNEQSDQWWAWGKGIYKIPSAANWTVYAEAYLPLSRPSGPAPDRCKAGLAIGLLNGKQVIHVKMRRYFDEGTYVIDTDLDYSPGQDHEVFEYTISYDRYLIQFSHDALRQQDSLLVHGQNGVNPPVLLFSQNLSSQLCATALVGFGAVVSGKPYWPYNNTTLGLDNWSVVADNPEPIDLEPKNGVGYSVAVTGLDLVNQKLTGTAALTVGSASATLPITGSIDKNGYFALSAKGTGAHKGFGCVLLYNVATGTFRPNKNTVTAPGQRPVRF